MLFRRRHELRQHMGTVYPDLVLSLVIDAMDNAKTTLPRMEGLLHSKKLDNKGQTLACELLAVLVHGHMFYGSLVLPHLKTNAATSLTVLHQVFIHLVRTKGFLPPILLIQADNSGKDNKNQFMLAYLGWLVENGFFVEARM